MDGVEEFREECFSEINFKNTLKGMTVKAVFYYSSEIFILHLNFKKSLKLLT